MHRNSQHRKFIFHPISQLALIALVIGVLPALAQNAAPPPNAVGPSTRQVIPAFASRLAHAAAQAKTRSTPQARKHASMCALTHPGSPQDNQIAYENGPVNGQDLGWTINFGFTVSDSMQVNTTVSGMKFWAWLIPGDTLTSVEVQMGAAAFGNELFDQTLNFTASNCFSNQFGYNVCLESANFTGPALSGNAWVTLGNASVPSGDPAYWDMNSGAGCASLGCPSQAEENTVGTIPSEAFTVLGNGTTSTEPPPPSCFQADDVLKIIHDFTSSEGHPYGVTIDKTGNLYGTSFGGDYGAGMAFRMAPKGEGWLFTPLYSFPGGDNGSGPSPVIVGPDGALYGTATGGLKNCYNGSSYCGLVFRLRPPPFTCATTLCGWREDVIYLFTGGSDGSDPSSLAFDSVGNLYGIAAGGIIFKLTPSPGGWTETVLYTLTDGNADSLVAGNDGSLYGTTMSGGESNDGTVFQLVPSPGGWTRNILYTFQGTENDGLYPDDLHQDSSGTLYGTSYYPIGCMGAGYGLVFQLSPSNGSWVFSAHGLETQDANYIDTFMADPGGGIYFAYSHYVPTWPWGYEYAWSEIAGNAYWWTSDLFVPGGPMAVDANFLYGTTYVCGQYNVGTLWSLRHY